MPAKKLVLLSIVVVICPGPRLATAAVPPRLSASAISAPPCSTPLRLLSCSVTTISAVTRSGDTCVTFMPMKSANGGCRSARQVPDVLSFMALRLPELAAARKPFGGELEVFLGQAVTRLQHFEGRVSAGLAEQRGEQPGLLRRDQFVVPAGQHQDRKVGEVGQRPRVERQHGAHQDRAGERLRLGEDHRPRDVGAVGVAERERRADPVGFAGALQEIDQLGGAALEVVDVPLAFAASAEEARHAVLEHLAARRQDAGAGCDPRRERQQVVLVAAGAVQQQQRSACRVRSPG